MARTQRGPVEQAVRRDLKAAGQSLRAPSGLAASALGLAQLLDGEVRTTCPECAADVTVEVEVSARDAATLAAELRVTLTELGKRKPTKPVEDSLAKRRARRAARGAAG